MINASIISIGDEICIGQIVNSNAAWIAEKLTLCGVNVRFHSSVRDSEEDIIGELNRLIPASEIIIITGGLGPTHDDITKDVLTKFFDDKLEFNNAVFESIKARYASRNMVVSERNRKQAELPHNCRVLRNEVGTAPGMLFETAGKYIISLPGVPSEMKFIMNDSVIPLISNKARQAGEIVLYRVLQTSGIPESTLADKIGDVNDFLGNGTLAFLPSAKGVRLRIGAIGSTMDYCKSELDRIENILRTKAGKYIFSTGDVQLMKIIADRLIEKSLTVSVAESCTGGLLGAEFTSMPGSSAYFIGGIQAYSNDVKTNQLGVEYSTIEKHGAVSRETAEEMSKNIRRKMNTDFGISITGIAGPDGGTAEKPVGTVWIAIANANAIVSQSYLLGNDRNSVRERAVTSALNLLYKILSEMK